MSIHPNVAEKLTEKLRLLPDKPGVYLMKDSGGAIIYVGKAVSLKNRVRSYFQSSKNQSPKVRILASRIADVEYIVTDSEVEALILECNLIKKHAPWFNVKLKDDKHYPYLKIDLNETFPRIQIVRRMKRDNARYFGPFTNSHAVRETLKFLRRLFPVRTCRKAIEPGGSDRPCLNYHIDRCTAPCAGKIDVDDYRKTIDQIIRFLEGRQESLIPELEERMHRAARDLQFEKAAVLRDQIRALQKVTEQQRIVSEGMEDLDVIACAREAGLACVQTFFVRGGKITGRDNFMLEPGPESDESEIIGAFIEQFYSDSGYVPPLLLVQSDIERPETVEEWLSSLRGSRVEIRVPKRGPKKRLMKLAGENARTALDEERARQERKRKEIEQGMNELKEALGLEKLPVRIEAYDISNFQGNESVGSMVVFEAGDPVKQDYRRFRIRLPDGPDDYAMMKEVIWRRFARGLKERDEIAEAAGTAGAAPDDASGFARFPDLVLIDGGKGQLNAALSAMKELGIGEIPACGLAKEFEQVFVPGKSAPVSLPPQSHGSLLLQRIRDEAHRFAVSYHRSLRNARTTESALDRIPGVGPKRKKALITHFGSARKVLEASLDELKRVPGIPEQIAERIFYFER